MKRRKHRPVAPGEILKADYLEPYGITQRELADRIEVDIKVVNRIVNGRSAISPTVAVKLAYALRTTLDFWLRAQNVSDLYAAEQSIKRYPKALI